MDPPIEGWCQTVPSGGNARLILRLDPPIRSGLQAPAMSKGGSVSELAKFVLVEYVKQPAEAKEGTPALLRREPHGSRFAFTKPVRPFAKSIGSFGPKPTCRH